MQIVRTAAGPLLLTIGLPVRVTARAGVEVRPGWLALAMWGLLVAGAVLILLGMATLVWPTRRKAPVRPATLADILPPPVPPPAPAADRPRPAWAAPTPMPVRPFLVWPPHPSVAVTPAPLADAEPEPTKVDPVGPGLPGSADLARALKALDSASPATRRRRTAAGLPSGPVVPPSASRPPAHRARD